MGNFNSFLKTLGLAPHEIRILILGLDAAGKTTILYKMKLGEIVTTIPTIGFNVETINHNNLNIVTFDVGGRDKIRPLFRHYYQNTQALIYVIDSNDKERINEVEEEISKMLREDELRDCVFMILANKQDLKNSMKADEIKKLINFDSIKQTPKNIFETTATTGEGLKEAFDWLTSCFENGKKKENFLTQPLNETVEDIKKLRNVTSFFFKWSNLVKAITE